MFFAFLLSPGDVVVVVDVDFFRSGMRQRRTQKDLFSGNANRAVREKVLSADSLSGPKRGEGEERQSGVLIIVGERRKGNLNTGERSLTGTCCCLLEERIICSQMRMFRWIGNRESLKSLRINEYSSSLVKRKQ